MTEPFRVLVQRYIDGRRGGLPPSTWLLETR